jgi:hypothetical protein
LRGTTSTARVGSIAALPTHSLLAAANRPMACARAVTLSGT